MNQQPVYPYPPQGQPPYGQPNKDIDQLKMLSVFYYVMGGLASVGLIFVTIWMFIMRMILTNAALHSGSNLHGPGPEDMADFVFLIGMFWMVIGIAVTVLLFMTAYNLRKQTRYNLIFATSCIICLSIPFGTALGVFSIIVLRRASVRQLFGRY